MQTRMTDLVGNLCSRLRAAAAGLVMLLSSNFVLASPSVTLTWNPNTEPDLASYNVYFGTASANYTNKTTAGNSTTNLVQGLVRGVKYYFAVTAVNTSGAESDFSNEISYTPPLTSLDLWRSTNFTPAVVADPSKELTVWGDSADPDNDGRDNLMEFALGLDPNKSDPTTDALNIGTADVSGSKYATISFRARKNEPLLQYVPEVSSDGQAWLSGPAYLQPLSTTSIDATFETDVVRDLTPLDPSTPRFIRLRVIKNDL